tara:strand:+ start:1180 stop:2151 length:972 start_codon:yes stop_codon:yes gene_type:complete
MRWIGQHIWRFISRFYSSVYFNSVEEYDSDPDKFLAIDTNNKLVYRTGENVLDDIGAGTGTITGVTITTDSGGGSAASDTTGSADFSLLGSSGVDITNSGTTITARAVAAEIDHDSLNNFVAAEHIDWTQAVGSDTYIHADNIYNINAIQLGSNTDTTIARSAAGTVTIEGKQIVTQATEKWIKNVCYTATQSTDETFIPLAGSAENLQEANGNVAMVMPVDGKLLKVHLKTQRDHSGVTTTIKMYNWDADEAHGNTTETLLGSVAQTGPANDAVGVFDFQSVSTNEFTAGEMLTFSITNSSAVSSSCKYFVTLVFELDWSSY